MILIVKFAQFPQVSLPMGSRLLDSARSERNQPGAPCCMWKIGVSSENFFSTLVESIELGQNLGRHVLFDVSFETYLINEN